MTRRPFRSQAYKARRNEEERLRLYRNVALRLQGWRCLYCHCPLGRRTVTGDHAISRKAGGETTQENIKAACGRCNVVKDTMHWQAFLKLVEAPPYDDTPLARAIRSIAFDRRIWSLTWMACERIAAQVGIDPAPPMLAAFIAADNKGGVRR